MQFYFELMFLSNKKRISCEIFCAARVTKVQKDGKIQIFTKSVSKQIKYFEFFHRRVGVKLNPVMGWF